MSAASFKVQIAFGGTGLFGTSGSDVTSRIRYRDGLKWSRGKDVERIFSPPVANTFDLVLDNINRDLSPGNTSSPLYVNGQSTVLPGRKVQLTTTSPARTLWTGFTDEMHQLPARTEKSVAFGCLDSYARLPGKTISTALYENILISDAINKLLDAIGWPGNERVIDAATVTLAWWWLDKEDAGSALLSLLLTEGPLASVYIDGRGYLVFEANDYRTTETRCTVSQATFNDTTNSEFNYEPNFKGVISKCRLTQTERAAQLIAPIWSYGSEDLVLGNNEVRQIEVKGSDPFKNAVVPQPFGTNAIQLISPRVPLTSGDFDAGFKGEFATGLAYNISAATLRADLEALTTIGAGNVICGGGPLNVAPISVEFRGALKEAPQPPLVIKSRLNASTHLANLSVTETVPIDAGIDQEFTFHHDETFTGGVFKVKFGSLGTTPTILYNIITTGLEAACNNTSLFNPGDVTAGGGPLNTDDMTLTIHGTQIGPGPPIDKPTIVGSSLMASKYVDALKVTEVQKGGGPDYVLVAGAVTFVLDRDNGGSVTLSATAGSSGATIAGLQVRAQAVTVVRTNDVAWPQTEVLDPQGQVYSPEIRPEISLVAAKTLAQTIWDRNHVAIPTVPVVIKTPLSDASACDAILAREISDRVTLANTQTGISEAYYIERMDHVVQNKVLTSTFDCIRQGDAASLPSVAGKVRLWRGIISQSGTSAPTAVVLENGLGGTVVFSRTSAGHYVGTLTGAFLENRTQFFPSNVLDPANDDVVAAYRLTDGTFALNTGSQGGSFADGVMTTRPVYLEIVVYSTPFTTALEEGSLYRALLTQDDDSDVAKPEAIVLDNSFSGGPVWQRNSEGEYFATIDGGFDGAQLQIYCNSIRDVDSLDQVGVAIAASSGAVLSMNTGTVDLGADTGDFADGIIADRPLDLQLIYDAFPFDAPDGTEVYAGRITQSGTSAPVTNMLQQSLGWGATPTLARVAAGRYTFTVPGRFQSNATFIKINSIETVEGGDRVSCHRLNNNTLALLSGSPAAGYFESGSTFGSDGRTLGILAYDSSPSFAPSDISGLKLWLEADALPLIDGDGVGLWPDSSGNSNNATQATGGLRPVYKTAILNGKPVVRFDATDDVLTVHAAFSQPNTIFVVGSMRGANAAFFSLSEYIFTDGSGVLSIHSASTLASAFTPGAGTFMLLAATFNSPTCELRKNGVQIISGNSGASGLLADWPIGAAGGRLLGGDIAEILLFDSALSTGNKQAVEAYLNAKYAIY